MITVNFVDEVQEKFGKTIHYIGADTMMTLIINLAEEFNLNPKDIGYYRYLLNGKEIKPQKYAKTKLYNRDGVMIMP